MEMTACSFAEQQSDITVAFPKKKKKEPGIIINYVVGCNINKLKVIPLLN